MKKDLKQALALYERAAGRSGWARAKLGLLHFEAKDYAKALPWLRRAADEGNPAARNTLGVMYDRGLGVKVDHAAARDLWHSSDDPRARGNLAGLYAEGRGAPSGPAAVEWYRTGAQAGVASAQFRLGMMYAKGEHVAQDDRAAAQWLTRAAGQGHPQARKEAGELFYRMGLDAARRLSAKLGRTIEPPKPFPPPEYPSGASNDPGKDPYRETAVRIAGVGTAHAAAVDAAIGNVYDIIRWFPEAAGSGSESGRATR
jgi:TPR repeat protein